MGGWEGGRTYRAYPEAHEDEEEAAQSFGGDGRAEEEEGEADVEDNCEGPSDVVEGDLCVCGWVGGGGRGGLNELL